MAQLAFTANFCASDYAKLQAARGKTLFVWGTHMAVDPESKQNFIYHYVGRVESFDRVINKPGLFLLAEKLLVDLRHSVVAQDPRRTFPLFKGPKEAYYDDLDAPVTYGF